MEPYQTLNRQEMYKGRIIDVVCDEITLPDGRAAYREMVVHGGASAIIPIDSEGKLILVRQYRHPAGELVLEIPAGMLEKGEDPAVCAARELEEETGFRSADIRFLFSMYSAIGFCNEVLYIYLAKDLEPGTMKLDEDEFVTVEHYTLPQAIDMIFSGGIKDSKTIAAILAYRQLQQP